MKKIEVLVFILFVSFVGFGQKQKVIDKKVKNQCEYKRQKGKRIIIKNDSLGYISYKTKNSELIIYEYHFLGFTAETKEGAKKDYLYSDSLITMLFINGLLTSDLLIKEYCNQSAYFYNKKRINNTKDMKFVKLLGIFKKNQSNSNEVNDGTLSYEIWITFDPNEDGWGSFHVFDLTLKSSIDIEKEGIVKYLKHAKINCLNYVGIQI